MLSVCRAISRKDSLKTVISPNTAATPIAPFCRVVRLFLTPAIDVLRLPQKLPPVALVLSLENPALTFVSKDAVFGYSLSNFIIEEQFPFNAEPAKSTAFENELNFFAAFAIPENTFVPNIFLVNLFRLTSDTMVVSIGAALNVVAKVLIPAFIAFQSVLPTLAPISSKFKFSRNFPICRPIISQLVVSIAAIIASSIPFAHTLMVRPSEAKSYVLKNSFKPVPIDFPKSLKSNVFPNANAL